jgi:hypothetical protein
LHTPTGTPRVAALRRSSAQKDEVVSLRRGRYAGFLLMVTVGLLVAQATPAGAANPVRFGSRLTNSDGSVEQPSNAPEVCDQTGPHDGDPCTLVSVRANSFDPGTKEKAPKDGTIRKVRLVAAHSGSFRLFFAKAHPASDEAKVVKRGPLITFNGDNSSPYTIEVRNVNITVKKGWYIAAKASTFETVQCTQGGQQTMEFQPPLVVGDPFETMDDNNGCYLLVQLQYG